MIQSFYKQTPVRDTPYRELYLGTEFQNGEHWEVRLLGGTKWGSEHGTVLRVIKVKDFDEGKPIYDGIYRELRAEGWKPYHPAQSWD